MTRAFAMVVAVLVFLTVLAPASSASAASAATAGTAAQGVRVTDEELVEALNNAELLDVWLDQSSVSPQAALLQVRAGADHDARRDALLDQLAAVARRTQFTERRHLALERATKQVSVLESVVRDVRTRMVADAETGGIWLLPADAYNANIALEQIVVEPWSATITLNPMQLVNLKIAQARHEIEREIAVLSEAPGVTGADAGVSLGVLARVPQELAEAHLLISAIRETNESSRMRIEAERVDAGSLMVELHSARLLAESAVGGLPLITVDAYIRAGQRNLDDGCPVSWNILAGIGHVESRHGTMDDASVLASGNVSTAIYGPLLDGGATEYEAELLAAEEEAALLAEEAALQAEEDARMRAFNVALWGEDGLESAAEVAADAADQDAEESAADESGDGEPVSPEPEPEFDPALWGDWEPFGEGKDKDADSEDGEDSDGEGEDDEEDGPKGNGFAVIEDSDNGVLDGNDRWDRAVGPMQFIPETWSNWSVDGNGDGTVNPQNLYDAAASAGNLLCHLRERNGSSPYTYILGYNASDTYVRNVMTVADRLGAFELPIVPERQGS